jgi:Protein of unknown function (DUF2865)
MLRVGHGQTKSIGRSVSRTSPKSRLAALTACAMSLGATATVLGVSFVQAGDDASPRAFLNDEAQRGRVSRSSNLFDTVRAPRAAPLSAPAFYAPAPRTVSAPIFRTTIAGTLLEPEIVLNPFAAQTRKTPRKSAKKLDSHIKALAPGDNPALEVVSGASNTMRSICVRLCDGYHAPIGYLSSPGDLPAHEALCRASNPGLPVKAFRVAAGAATIGEATSSDGKTYASLPMAYAYEKSGDPSCRPAIAQVNERRVSLLRDFTLRAGDTVVLDGRAKVFNGSSQWPYRASDFRDFRQSQQLNAAQRQRIDNIIGLSRLEASRRAERRNALVREASLITVSMSDIGPAFLRGSVGADVERGPVRVIAPQTLGTHR